ncbi:MAG: chromate transporter [Clostridium sp.]
MKELIELFWSFSKIGALTFGGGYSMLPMLQKEVVEKKKWATEQEVMDYFAVGQCTPGVIAVNTATFIGYKQRGILGGIFAAFGVTFPSLIIIIIIAAFLQNFMDIVAVQHAFAGIRVAVVALIIDAIIKIGKTSIVNIQGVIIAIIAFLMTAFSIISPAYIIVGAAVTGLLSRVLRGKKI